MNLKTYSVLLTGTSGRVLVKAASFTFATGVFYFNVGAINVAAFPSDKVLGVVDITALEVDTELVKQPR